MNPRENTGDDQDPDAPFEQPVEDSTGELPGGGSHAQQLRDAEDRVLRAQAELENFRKRSRREYEDAIRYREIDLLRDLQKRLGMGMVLVTHNFGVVADLADRVVVMQYGRVVETGPVRDILRAPQEKYTQVLLSSMLEGKTPMTMLTDNAKEQ